MKLGFRLTSSSGSILPKVRRLIGTVPASSFTCHPNHPRESWTENFELVTAAVEQSTWQRWLQFNLLRWATSLLFDFHSRCRRWFLLKCLRSISQFFVRNFHRCTPSAWLSLLFGTKSQDGFSQSWDRSRYFSLASGCPRYPYGQLMSNWQYPRRKQQLALKRKEVCAFIDYSLWAQLLLQVGC